VVAGRYWLWLLLWLSAVLAQPPVLETTPMAVDEFNRRLEAAAASGAIWPRDPLLVTREFVGGLGGRYLSFQKDEGPGESVVVTAMRDGMRDPRLAGVWYRLRLSPRWQRPADEVSYQLWIVEGARRAWRCRGREGFGVEPCA